MTTTKTSISIHAYASIVPSLRAEGKKWQFVLPPGSTTCSVRYLYRALRQDGLDPIAARRHVVLAGIAFSSRFESPQYR